MNVVVMIRCEIDAHAHFRGHIVCCVGWGISRKNLKEMTRFYITEREEVEERCLWNGNSRTEKYSPGWFEPFDCHQSPVLAPQQHLEPEERRKVQPTLEYLRIHTWANMGTVSGRTGTKTEVSAGTFVELFGAVVTWKLLYIFIRAIFNETGNSSDECKFIEVPW